MIGVGIITYNRLKILKVCLKSVVKFTRKRHRILVADDGSTDGTRAWIKKMGIKCLSGPNVGIAKNKNRLLWAFRDCEAAIIIEDDTEILKKGWADRFLKASKVTGEHHFCLSFHKNKKDFTKKTQGFVIRYAFRGNGYCMFFTRRAIKVCGGFDRRFGKYGYEHADFSYRIWRAGLTGGQFPHLGGMEGYVKLRWKARTSVSKKVRSKEIPLNRKVYNRSREETNAGKWFRPYEPK